jgi:glycosyltransferase involved in cell wall biosynthesis
MMMHPYLKVAKGLNIKTIIHIREHWPKNGHTFQYNIAKKIIEKYADHIVAINKQSASMVNAPQKTTVVYDWIDFSQRDENFSFTSVFGKDYKILKIFTFTGGIDNIKGTMEIIKTFSSKIIDKNARLLMPGVDTTFDYRGFRGTIARYLSIFNYDTYSNKVKKIILNDNRIVCIPSTYKLKQIIEESLCILSFFTIPHANLILAEAISLGQIVIAARTPEALEYSNNGDSAILFEMNNMNEFAEKIENTINNYDYYRNKAKSGMEYIKLLFDPIRNSSLLDKIYTSLLH